MATSPEGIMALGQPTEAGGPPTPAMPELSRSEFYDISRQAMQTARPDLDLELEENLQRFRAMADKIPENALRYFLNVFQQILDHPEDYKEARQALLEAAPEVGKLLPKEFDEETLSVIAFIFEDALRSRRAPGDASTGGIEALMPQKFAKGGIAEAARLVASQGRGGDTMLAHINPREAQLLKAFGGAGTINPKTGQPEFIFKWIKENIWDPVVDVGRDVIKGVGDFIGDAVDFIKTNPVARIAATVALAYFLGPGALKLSLPTAAAAASGTVTAITGGNLKDIALSSLTAYIGAPGGPVSNLVGKYAPAFVASNPLVSAAVSGTISGTAGGLIQGQSLGDSLRSGLTEGAVSGVLSFADTGDIKKASVDAADATLSKTVADAVPANPNAASPLELDQLKTDQLDQARLNVNQVVETQVAPPPDLQTIVGGNTRKMLDEAAGISSVPVDTGLDTRALSAAESNYDLAPSAAGGPGTSGYLVDAQGRTIANAPPLEYTVTGPNAPDVGTYSQASAPLNIEGKIASPEVPIVERSDLINKAGLEDMRIARNEAGGALVPEGGIGNVPPYKPGGPDIIPSLKKAGTPGTMMEGLEDLFAPGPSKEQIFDFAKKNNMTYDAAEKYLSPNFMRTYGPTAAAGIAGLALMGGFSPDDPNKSKEQQEFEDRMRTSSTELLERDPRRYYLQNIPGVLYDERGAVIGSGQYQPSYSLADVTGGRGASSYTQPAQATYTPSAFMSPYGEQYLNQGGIATLRAGGYPRRTGQISGPGTETSDDIPAMLSDGEFVMTARAVRGMGNGSRREGARKMYALMHKLENNASRG